MIATLKSGWLTAGPRVAAFEERFSRYKGGVPSIAVNSCTSGIFLALKCLNLQPGDEVITTPMTFVATSNSIVHAGGKVVFADIDPDTMNLDPAAVERAITPRTRAILPVHIGGTPCQMDSIMELAVRHQLKVVEDCAHAIEGEFGGKPLGTIGDFGAFSFYPTKNITAGEGGMVTCRSTEDARMVRLLGRHGLDKGTFQRMEQEGEPLYDVLLPGFKTNMTDLQAAIGIHQMDKLESMYQQRVTLRKQYDEVFAAQDTVQIIGQFPPGKSALHLYLLVLQPEKLTISRGRFIQLAREQGVELSVNYTPIHLFSWYRSTFCTVPGAFPKAEFAGANVISLPFYPALTALDTAHIFEVLTGLLTKYRR